MHTHIDFYASHISKVIYSIPQALALLAVVGWFFMAISYGTAAPTGLFIPSLVTGAAGGRLVGVAVR